MLLSYPLSVFSFMFLTRKDAFLDLASFIFPDIVFVYRQASIGIFDHCSLHMHALVYEKCNFLTRSIFPTRIGVRHFCCPVNLNLLPDMMMNATDISPSPN